MNTSYRPIVPIIALVLITLLCLSLRDEIVLRFMAHAGLNGLIVATFFFGLVLAGLNWWHVVHTAKSITLWQRAVEMESVDPFSIQEIINLADKSVLRSTQMRAVIERSNKNRTIGFTDVEARLIKTKLGARLGRLRGRVSYMTATLIMLGLIGTFWGLLETINSVGEAMHAVVETMDKATQTVSNDADPMAKAQSTDKMFIDFLGSVSAPLQGMGVAFSASLFGLCGSLILGLMGVLFSKIQDRFVEDLSIWIDDHIDNTPVYKEKISANPAANAVTELTKSLEQHLGAHSTNLSVVASMAKNLERHLEDSGTRIEAALHSSSNAAVAQIVDAIEAGIQRAIESTVRAIFADLQKNLNKNLEQIVALLEQTLKEKFGPSFLELINNTKDIKNGVNRFSTLVGAWQDYVLTLERSRTQERDILLSQLEALVMTTGVSVDTERQDIAQRFADIRDSLASIDKAVSSSAIFNPTKSTQG